MAVDLNKVKHELNDINRQEDRALAAIQKYFESSSNNKPSKVINLTTNLSLGGYTKPISTTQINLGAANDVLGMTVQDRSIRHNHSIDWKDIEDSYRLREAMHSWLSAEYLKHGKLYGGRSLFQQGEFKDAVDAAGRKIKQGEGSKVIVPWTPYGRHGRYEKIDVDIHRKMLDEFYGRIWKATNKELLDKFNTMDLSGGDFKKLIKVTKELAYDIKLAKGWKKEVEELIKSAEIRYKAIMKQMQNQINKEALKNMHVLTIEQLETIGRAILGLAIEYCPIETGRLRRSGKLYVSDNDIRIIFECEYAAYVHDNVNAQHPVGQAKYLEKAAQDILPKISVWTETTGDNSFVLGDYMKQTWDKNSAGGITSDMYWVEHKGYQAVYIDIDRDLRVNYAHYK